MAHTSMNRLGRVRDPDTRVMVTTPSSRGWRRVSRAVLSNSGSSSRNRMPLARVQAVYAKRLDNSISHPYGGNTPVLKTATPGVAVMGLIHPTKKGTPENYSILLGFLFILTIIATSFAIFNWCG